MWPQLALLLFNSVQQLHAEMEKACFAAWPVQEDSALGFLLNTAEFGKPS